MPLALFDQDALVFHVIDVGSLAFRVVIGVDLGYSHGQHVPLNILVMNFHVLVRISLHLLALAVAWICELKPVLVGSHERGKHAVYDDDLLPRLVAELLLSGGADQ